MTKTKPRIARAVSTDRQSCYDVTYDGSRDLDSYVGYGYLKDLAKKGWEVHVTNGSDTHIIPAEKS